MDLHLKGKTCLVTGSSSGIGEGIVKVLAAEGVRVAVHGRSAERADAVAQEIRRAGGEAIVVLGDLSSNAAADEVASQVLAQFGAVDILVNNAGHSNPRGPVAWLDTDEEDFLSLYNENVVSGIRMIRRLVPTMKSRGWGRVIMMASVGAVQPVPLIPDYQASKAAMVNYTVSLSKALARTGITVNCLTPGPIMSPMQRNFLRDLSKQFGWGDDDKVIEQRSAEDFFQITLDRLGTPADIGHLVAFLSSPLAGFITGSDYRIDGGMIKAIN